MHKFIPILILLLAATSMFAAGSPIDVFNGTTSAPSSTWQGLPVDLYVYTNPAYYYNALNAVAMMTKDATFKGVWAIFAAGGTLYTAFLINIQRDSIMKLGYNYAFILTMVVTMLYSSTTVHIVDERTFTNPSYYNAPMGAWQDSQLAPILGEQTTFAVVDNVPYGLAVPMGISNAFSVWLTHIAEDTLSSDSPPSLGFGAIGYGKNLEFFRNFLTSANLSDLNNAYPTNVRTYINQCLMNYAKVYPQDLELLQKSDQIMVDMDPLNMGSDGSESVQYRDKTTGAPVMSAADGGTGTCLNLYNLIAADETAEATALFGVHNNGLLNIINITNSACSPTSPFLCAGGANSAASGAFLNLALARSMNVGILAAQTGLTSGAAAETASAFSQMEIQANGLTMGKFLNDTLPMAVTVLTLVTIFLFPVSMMFAVFLQNYKAPLMFFLTLLSLDLVNPTLAICQNITNLWLAGTITDIMARTSASAMSLMGAPMYLNEVLTMAGTSGILSVAGISLVSSLVFFGGTLGAGAMAAGIANAYKGAEASGRQAANQAGAEQARVAVSGTLEERYGTELANGIREFSGSFANRHLNNAAYGNIAKANVQNTTRSAAAEGAQLLNEHNGEYRKSIEAAKVMGKKGVTDAMKTGEGISSNPDVYNKQTGEFSDSYKKGVANQAGESANATAADGANRTQSQANQSGQWKGEAAALVANATVKFVADPESKANLLKQIGTDTTASLKTQAEVSKNFSAQDQIDSKVGAALGQTGSAITTTKTLGGTGGQMANAMTMAEKGAAGSLGTAKGYREGGGAAVEQQNAEANMLSSMKVTQAQIGQAHGVQNLANLNANEAGANVSAMAATQGEAAREFGSYSAFKTFQALGSVGAASAQKIGDLTAGFKTSDGRLTSLGKEAMKLNTIKNDVDGAQMVAKYGENANQGRVDNMLKQGVSKEELMLNGFADQNGKALSGDKAAMNWMKSESANNMTKAVLSDGSTFTTAQSLQNGQNGGVRTVDMDESTRKSSGVEIQRNTIDSLLDKTGIGGGLKDAAAIAGLGISAFMLDKHLLGGKGARKIKDFFNKPKGEAAAVAPAAGAGAAAASETKLLGHNAAAMGGYRSSSNNQGTIFANKDGVNFVQKEATQGALDAEKAARFKANYESPIEVGAKGKKAPSGGGNWKKAAIGGTILASDAMASEMPISSGANAKAVAVPAGSALYHPLKTIGTIFAYALVWQKRLL